MSREKAFIVIPAYNEQDRIAPVVEAAQAADPVIVSTEQVIVVDNNSTDCTGRVARSMGATVLTCEEPGKGWAMLAGATYALENNAAALTFLDGDLIGLTPDHVNQLVWPVLTQEAVMSIGYLGGRRAFAKKILNYWGGFSGQRTACLDIWDQLSETDFEKWRIEGALNAVCRNMDVNDMIQRIELQGLYHRGKRSKEPTLFHAGLRYAQTYSSAIRGLMSRSGTRVEPVNLSR